MVRWGGRQTHCNILAHIMSIIKIHMCLLPSDNPCRNVCTPVLPAWLACSTGNQAMVCKVASDIEVLFGVSNLCLTLCSCAPSYLLAYGLPGGHKHSTCKLSMLH